MPVKGTYCLCIKNSEDKSIKIGALGSLFFEKRYYIYVGSALNSLIPRLERHLKTSTSNHHVTRWHIDYLLREKPVEIEAIYIIESDRRLECEISNKVDQHGEPLKGFGCSDCKCVSHLYKVENYDFLEKIGLKKWY